MPMFTYALIQVCICIVILVIVCMSSLEGMDDLDVELWLRPCKRYHWYRLTPEGIVVMDLGRLVVED
jgi:hypothetical protein